MFRKIIKHHFYPIILLMTLTVTTPLAAAGTKEDREQQEVSAILANFDKLIFNNLGKNKDITNRCVLYYQKINSGELSIVVDYTLGQDIYEGMGFTSKYLQTGFPAILISPHFLKVYRQGHPSIFYSALIHEIAHVNDFFSNPAAFQNGETNLLEKYLYKMDAAYIESVFIRDILSPNMFTLTKYESYMMNSLAKDNLASFSLSFKSVDMELIYRLLDITHKEIPKKEKIKQVVEVGQKLLTQMKYPEKGSDWERYCVLVPLQSYCLYVPQVLVDIESVATPGFDYRDLKIENYPNVKENLDRINNETGNAHFAEIQKFRQNLLKMYGKL